MKTPEDEAFDDLAKRQGAWGGGYQAKRQMAADKFCDANCVWTDHHPDCNMAANKMQEPDALIIAYQFGFYDGKKAALAGREWNFCERCGKRTADKTAIHTCIPPQGPA